VLIPVKTIARDDERDDNTMTMAVADEAAAAAAAWSPRHRQNGTSVSESMPAMAAIDSAEEWPLEEPVESISLPPARQSPDNVVRSTRNGNGNGHGHVPRDSSNGIRDNALPTRDSGPPQDSSSDRPRRPLPRRRRQANLAPQLQVDPPSAPETTNEPRHTRSPEQARNSMASFQQGTRQGRGDSSSSGQHNR
jgi:hypothetical protein